MKLPRGPAWIKSRKRGSFISQERKDGQTGSLLSEGLERDRARQVLKWGELDPQLWLIKPVVIAAFRSLGRDVLNVYEWSKSSLAHRQGLT